MFCPNCASQVAEDQKFCRACGLQLDAVVKILAGSNKDQPSGKSQPGSGEDNKAMPRPLRLGVVTMMIGLLVGCLIPIIAGVKSYTPSVTPLIPILAGLAGIFLFAGVIIMFGFESTGAGRK